MKNRTMFSFISILVFLRIHTGTIWVAIINKLDWLNSLFIIVVIEAPRRAIIADISGDHLIKPPSQRIVVKKTQ
jgi:hypothetical protein